MSNFYPYLISSLPALSFGQEPPFSWEKFCILCSEFIPEKDFLLLKQASIDPKDYGTQDPGCAVLKKWFSFDTGLRNELAKIRAARKHLEPQVFLRPGLSADMAAVHLAHSAQRSPSIPEAEKILDLERWHKLEEFSFGRYFDHDALIAYALKLLILLRWQKAKEAPVAQKLLAEVLQKS